MVDVCTLRVLSHGPNKIGYYTTHLEVLKTRECRVRVESQSRAPVCVSRRNDTPCEGQAGRYFAREVLTISYTVCDIELLLGSEGDRVSLVHYC